MPRPATHCTHCTVWNRVLDKKPPPRIWSCGSSVPNSYQDQGDISLVLLNWDSFGKDLISDNEEVYRVIWGSQHVSLASNNRCWGFCLSIESGLMSPKHVGVSFIGLFLKSYTNHWKENCHIWQIFKITYRYRWAPILSSQCCCVCVSSHYFQEEAIKISGFSKFYYRSTSLK